MDNESAPSPEPSPLQQLVPYLCLDSDVGHVLVDSVDNASHGMEQALNDVEAE